MRDELMQIAPKMDKKKKKEKIKGESKKIFCYVQQILAATWVGGLIELSDVLKFVKNDVC